MRATKSIQISIPHPCTQSWDEMRPSGSGRFCNHCQKTVIDFTTWSDAAFYNFFANNTGQVCGRFLPTQLDRKISVPYQPNSRLYRLTVALGLTLLIAQTPALHAQSRAPLIAQTGKAGQTHKPGTGIGIVRGRVVNEQNHPMSNAAVHAVKDGIIVSDTYTDNGGNYTMELWEKGTYGIVFAFAGFETATAYIAISAGVNEVQPTILRMLHLRIPTGEIRQLPTGGAIDVTSLTGNQVYQTKRGGELRFDTVNKQKIEK